jgi:hypothetical protein
MKNIKHCIVCDKTFNRPYGISSKNKYWKRRKFCSVKCKHLWGKPEKVCPICEKKFRSWRYQNHIYCSKLCGNRSRPNRGGKIEIVCRRCGKKFIPTARGIHGRNYKYCSVICSGLDKSKKFHWNWKGGISKNHRRETKEYKEWRLNVYRRDYFTCQDCKKHCNQKNIVAHHLKCWDKFPELRYEVKNGITLCRHCHKIRHKN